MSRRRAIQRLPLFAIGAIFSSIAVVTVILRVTFPITMVRATRAVPIPTAVAIIITITVATIIFAW